MSRGNTTPTNHGFTLLEVLVVLVIMGLLVGLVSVVALPDDRARLGLESERLARLLALAREEARYGGRAIAWTTEGPGYHFLQDDREDGWQEIRGRDLLLPRTLPANMVVLGLRVENGAVSGPPRLEFGSDGASSAFTLELGLGDARATIAGSPVGDIAVVGDEAGHDAIPAPH